MSRKMTIDTHISISKWKKKRHSQKQTFESSRRCEEEGERERENAKDFLSMEENNNIKRIIWSIQQQQHLNVQWNPSDVKFFSFFEITERQVVCNKIEYDKKKANKLTNLLWVLILTSMTHTSMFIESTFSVFLFFFFFFVLSLSHISTAITRTTTDN